MIPSVTKVAFLVNPNSASDWKVYIQDMQAAVRSLGLDIIVLNATSGTDIEKAFASAVEQGASALMASAGEGFAASRRGNLPNWGFAISFPRSPARVRASRSARSWTIALIFAIPFAKSALMSAAFLR